MEGCVDLAGGGEDAVEASGAEGTSSMVEDDSTSIIVEGHHEL